MIVRRQGKVKTMYYPVTTSTALALGSLVSFTSGKLVAATASTTAVNIEGVLQKAITANDYDYATNRLVPVDVPVERFVVWLCDVTSGLVTTDIGVEVNLTDASTINRGSSTVGVAKCVKVISATQGEFLVKIGGGY